MESMTSPLVTVLVPVYNAEEYLRPALESILNQTYKNLEILIINDGSTDRSEKIILSYKDSRIRYVKQENAGVGETLRRGVEMAKGTLIRRMDADDIIAPNAIEVQLEFLQKHPEVGVVATKQCYITENGKIAHNKCWPKQSWFNGQDFRLLSFDDFRVDKTAPIVHSTAMYYKNLVIEAGNYRPWFKVAEDFDLWLRILERKKIAILNKTLFYVRIHGKSATATQKDVIQFYRQKVIEYSKIRRSGLPDPLQQGAFPAQPEIQKLKAKELPKPDGTIIREDLSFMYSFAVDAKDFKLWKKIAKEIVKYGWKRKQTYKMLLFPLLGEKIVSYGVKLKKKFKYKKNNSIVPES